LSVAVLIVNFHVYDDLARTLCSLAPQLAPDDEVVVVDQESDTARVGALAAAHRRVRFLPRADNLGFAAGVNLAARATSAPYLLLLNPDTIVDEPLLRPLEAWLATHPDTAVLGPRVLDADGTVQASARRFPGPTTALAGRSTWLTRAFPGNWLSRRNLPGREADAPMDVDWVAGSCFLTRRDVFDRLGGLDEQFFLYWEDADYCRRATRAGFRVVYLPTVRVRHIGGRSATLDPTHAVRAFHRSALHLYRKHGGLVARLTWPIAAAGLWARGEWRTRRALRAAKAAPTPGHRS
jgi:GT2 family glycosyltransferase